MKGRINMKKIISLITLLCIVFTLCIPAFAKSTDEDHARVLELIKGRIPSTLGFDEFSSSSYKTGDKMQYNFSWHASDNENFKSMQANVTDSGFITSFHYNDSSKEAYSEKPTLKKISSDFAMEKAKPLIEKLNPSLIDKFTLEANRISDLNSKTHSFNIQRTENGIPVYGDSGYVTVCENADTILSFNMQYTEGLTFPDFQNAISKEEAQNAFAEKIGMTLLYERKGLEAPDVAYSHNTYNTYIDAITSDAISPIFPNSDIYLNKYEASMEDSASDKGGGSNFSPAELKELENISGLMNEKDACTFIKSNSALKIKDSARLTHSYLYARDNDKYFYIMNFETDDGEYISVTFDAKSGKVRSFSRSFSEYKETNDKKSDEALAGKYVSILAPDHYKTDNSGKYRFEKCEANTFSFVRYEYDIPYFEDTVRIRISPENGEILSYNIYFSDLEFYRPKDIISEKEACEKLFSQIDYNLTYIPACTEEGKEDFDTVHLVYKLSDSATPIVYATSGTLMYEEDENETVGKYTDISGHWAESIINELAAYGIGFSESEFRPDEVIVQRDFVALITDITKRHYPTPLGEKYNYTSAYSYAENYNIIKENEEAPLENVTREKAAIYMIRAIDLEDVASLEGIYRPLYEDVTENIGYISLLSGMKIVSGYSGLFNPKREMTRAEAMVMIYNYLAN